jgi:hypothetical protein
MKKVKKKSVTVKKHFVMFMSPGTFFSETSEVAIPKWDIDLAIKKACGIKERYGATPYGFRFLTYGRGARDLDSKVIKSSGIYYLGGKVETYEEVCKRNDPKEEILRSNMKNNGIDKIIINDNSWRFTTGLNPGDKVLDVDMKALANAKKKKV